MIQLEMRTNLSKDHKYEAIDKEKSTNAIT